jgi:hypothetical protein
MMLGTNVDVSALFWDSINGLITLLLIDSELDCLVISSLFNWFDVFVRE